MKFLSLGLSAVAAAAIVSVVFAQVATVAGAPLPQGWLKAGSKPQDYEMKVVADPNTSGQQAIQVKSLPAKNGNGFGTFMQQFAANEYRGKSVRFSAKVRSNSVNDWAGLWMRVDDASGKVIAFDNMESRAIRGSTDWRAYEVVLPVADDAKLISFGILLAGAGEVNMAEVSVELAPNGSASTQPVQVASPILSKPTNLDFKQ